MARRSRANLDVSLPAAFNDVETPSYRPPDGGEILVMTTQPGTQTRGIYTYDVESGQTQTVNEPSAPNDMYSASWSPNGEWISFGQFLPVEAITSRVHVVAADGSGTGSSTRLPVPPLICRAPGRTTRRG